MTKVCHLNSIPSMMTSKIHNQSKPPTQKHCHCHNLYPRRPKPLYSLLPPDTIRVMRIVPGTRRGEYTAQMLEMPLLAVDDKEGVKIEAEVEYDVLRLNCDPELKARATKDSVEVKGKDMDTSRRKGADTATTTAIATATAPDTTSDTATSHAMDQTLDPKAQNEKQNQQSHSSSATLSIPSTTPVATTTTSSAATTTATATYTTSATTSATSSARRNTDHEKSFFPILSLGGGEHVIEIPLVVKKAIEQVVAERWDGVHANVPTFAAARRGSAGQGAYDDAASAADADGAEDDDDDDESIIGSGEDLYLWIAAVCIDQTDTEDRRQQGGLLGRIKGSARRVVFG